MIVEVALSVEEVGAGADEGVTAHAAVRTPTKNGMAPAASQ
jgi:hypothetical protein